MKKKILLAFIGVLTLAGLLAGIKALQIKKMVDQSSQFTPPPAPVTVMPVIADSWESRLPAVGSLSAVQGVTIAAELPGKVVAINFEPGSQVESRDLLLRQDTSTEEAALPGAEASVVLTKKNLERIRQLIADELVAQVELDTARANYERAVAEVESLRATIAKKKIRAPFAGRLGVRQVNLGQYLGAGAEIVTLQALDPIFVDFLMPQQQVDLLQPGLTLRLATSGANGRNLEGKITTINPKIDERTRNIRVQGLVRNHDETLRPGMYVDVDVILPEMKRVLMIPVTAVQYAPYGDSVFVVEPAGEEADSGKLLRQQLVELGEKRGDYVEVVKGLKAGEEVVTTGVFKLRNKQAVTIDNTLQPEFKLEPKPANR